MFMGVNRGMLVWLVLEVRPATQAEWLATLAHSPTTCDSDCPIAFFDYGPLREPDRFKCIVVQVFSL